MDIKKNYNQQKISLFSFFLIIKNFANVHSFIVLFCICSFSLSSQIEKSNDKTSQSARKLNVLLIIADDLNCDLGAYENLVPAAVKTKFS